ncbi:hypothetical protein JW758_04310 [Candidatus Peregrinibacteria bacterium]|nr:hypothetical protein [Candidatus Peregrinibacteria bacterium]
MKKLITTFLATIGLILIFSNTANARFVPYSSPDIKRDYCGPVMSAIYCKCAFHGQYCDSAGMDSAAANNYVYGAFAGYVEKKKAEFMNGCIGGGGIWTGSGCEYCDAPEFLWNGACKSVQDLCSDDSNVKFNTDSGQCYCPTGYDLMSDKSCERICGEDLSVKYDAEKSECYCDPGFELMEDKDRQLFCQSVCGDDPVIQFDLEKQECVCPDTHKLTEDEDGYKVCEEIPEIDITVEYVGETKPPLIADGESETKIKVTGKYQSSGDSVLFANFSVDYSNTPKKGSVSYELAGKDSSEGFMLTYKTADLEDYSEKGAYDMIYAYYYSDRQNKEVYKTIKVDLVTKGSVVATIKKPGFADTQIPVIFTGPSAKIKITTRGPEGEIYPVEGADITYEQFWTKYTDSSGEAVLESPEEVEGSDVFENEVVLEMSNDIKERWKNALAQYNDLETQGLPNSTILDFLYRYPKYLAEGDEQHAKKVVAGIKSVEYSLFFVRRGNVFADDLSGNLGEGVSNWIWDTMDFFNVVDNAIGGIRKKIGLDKALGVVAPNIDIDDAGDNLPIVGKARDLISQQLASNFKDGKDSMVKGLYTFFRSLMISSTETINPHSFDQVFAEVFGKLFTDTEAIGELTGIQGLKGMGAKPAYENNALSIKTLVTDGVKSLHKKFSEEQMGKIAKRVADMNFDEYATNAGIESAKKRYAEMGDKFLGRHESEYRASMFKATSELLLDTVGKAAQITAPHGVGLLAKYMEQGYKAMRIGVNSGQVANWVQGYGQNQLMIQNAIDGSLGYTSNVGTPSFVLHFIPSSYAEEVIDVMQNVYNKKLSVDDPARTVAADYTNAMQTSGFYDWAQQLMEAALVLEPENEELIQINNEISSEAEKVVTELSTVKAEVESAGLFEKTRSRDCDELDVNCDGEVNLKDITAAEWIALIVILGILILVVRFVIRLIRGKKKRRR